MGVERNGGHDERRGFVVMLVAQCWPAERNPPGGCQLKAVGRRVKG